jgi:hypothetical protein
MKPSIIITAITLIVAAAFGWHHHQQLVGLRAGNARLVEEAAAQGMSRNGESSTRHRERQEEDALAAEFIAFAREGGKLLEDGVGPDAETTKRSVQLMDRIMRLDASQLEGFLAEFRAAPGINELARKYMLMDCVLALSTRNPRAGLELFIQSPELLGEGSIARQHIGELLGNLAKDDPQSALEWIRANKEAHPYLVTDDLMGFLVAGVAAIDPKHAFQLLADLEPLKHAEAVSRIIEAAATPGQRDMTLAALRRFAAARQNPQILNDGISDLVFGGFNKKRGFEETSTWLTSAQLSGEELASATQNMEHRVKPDETARWLEWLGTSGLPEEVVRDRAYNLSAGWTERDYQAAGKWLASAPESPGKSAAVGAFAAKVHPFEPGIAMQWLETLPHGPDRNKALEAIHRGMQENKDYEKEAVDAFAREHGFSK